MSKPKNKKPEGKPPADQFYWGDWLRDEQLQQASAVVRGAWANFLAHAWFSKTRGRITGTRESLAQLCNCTGAEFGQFIEEARRYKFCDVKITQSRFVTKCHSGDGGTCHEIVTVTNRRQYRKWQKEEKERKDAAKRQREKRARDKSMKAVTDPSQAGHAKVTPSRARPSSSSSAYADPPLPPQGGRSAHTCDKKADAAGVVEQLAAGMAVPPETIAEAQNETARDRRRR